VQRAAFLLLSVTVSCALAQTPQLSEGSVVNAASFAAGEALAAGSLASVFGSQLASSLAQGASVPLSVSLGDVQSVTFDNIAAPLIFVDNGQINLQVPWEITGPSSVVVVHRSTGASSPVTVALSPVSPAIFAVNFGTGSAIAINADSSLAAPNGSIPGIATHPAKIGDTILILGTGLGAVDQPVVTGAKPATLTHTLVTPTVLVGGVRAEVQFSGLSPDFPGVNQLNVLIPGGAPTGDAVPLQLQMGGITTTDKVTIAIQ
jgi:uncharacterized protein (TIGR03437 family)